MKYLIICSLLIVIALAPNCYARTNPGTPWMLGPTGVQATRDGKNLRFEVTKVAVGSPADGKISVGDYIIGIGDQTFSITQYAAILPKGVKNWFECRAPQHEFGQALSKATTGGGGLDLLIDSGGATATVSLKLTVTQGFASTYPWNCSRSATLVDEIISVALAKAKTNHKGLYAPLTGLLILGADPQRYKTEATKLAQGIVNLQTNTFSSESGDDQPFQKSASGWDSPIAALFLCEYYLSCGRPAWIVPKLRHYADRLQDSMLPGGFGWGHRYGQGDYNGPYGAWSPTTAINILALLAIRHCNISIDEHVLNKQILALEGCIESGTGQVLYNSLSMNTRPDLPAILAQTGYVGNKTTSGRGSMFRQSYAALALSKAGRGESLAAVAHRLGQMRKLPGRGHAATSEWHGPAGCLALCCTNPQYGRECLDNWKHRYDLDTQATGSLYNNNPKNENDVLGLGNRYGFLWMGLTLTMHKKNLWLFSGVQDPSTITTQPLPIPTAPRPTGSVSPTELVELGGNIFFAGEDGSIGGKGLWKYDITNGRQSLIKGGFSSRPYRVVRWGRLLFFSIEDTSSVKSDPSLWISDGTLAGTTRIASVAPSTFTSYKGALYFSAPSTTSSDLGSLWKTDGTKIGTHMVIDGTDMHYGLGKRPHSHEINPIISALGLLFIASGVESGKSKILVSDGTVAGTIKIADALVINYKNWGTELGKRFYFGDENGGLWSSDGTVAGTTHVKKAAARPLFLTKLGNTLLFSGRRGVRARKQYCLWSSDGTRAGTKVLLDINPNGDSRPRYLTKLGKKVYFTANDGSNGEELWMSDGTEEGTQILLDINPGRLGSMIGEMVKIGDYIYFTATNGTHGLELWRTDGTAAGTEFADIKKGEAGSVPRNLFTSNNKLYFYTMTIKDGRDVWAYDPNGTSTPPELTFGKTVHKYPRTEDSPDIDIRSSTGSKDEGVVATSPNLYWLLLLAIVPVSFLVWKKIRRLG